jgi:hypothetical protein
MSDVAQTEDRAIARAHEVYTFFATNTTVTLSLQTD